MNRILVFHHQDFGNQTGMAPSAYYIEDDYEKVAVRLYAEVAPTGDAEFDILDDGVSIFNDRTAVLLSPTTGVRTRDAAKTAVVITAGENSEELAGDFNSTTIEKGSWVSCELVDGGGGRNFTVQLELSPVSEENVTED